MARPLALVTNDDGIHSPFLLALIQGLAERFEVKVAAPSNEQSWVSRSMTRHGKVSVEPHTFEEVDCEAWSVTGTPSDCVNIALGHLLPREPDVVVSGINIGYNATETLVFSSGTVAGAFEAAVWRIPALAVSKWLPREVWEIFRLGKPGAEEVLQSVRCDGARAAQHAETLLGKTSPDLIVHNLNFPFNSTMDTELVGVRPAPLRLGSLFEKKPEGHYEFTYAQGEVLDESEELDYPALMAGKITYSVLNFSAVGSAPKKE